MEGLLGMWVQDNYSIGSRKAYVFRADGSFEFTAAVGAQILEQEEGTYVAEEGTLTLSPTAGPARSVGWTVEKDPAVGTPRLVFGGNDIYYRPF
jgi:hypothetical protein